jgi:hypothetical protein
MTYQEQIAHPKWQKKRLEILQRDNFTCTLCGDTETTLHIHHEEYGKFAWSVDSKYLHTRCSHCHLLEEYYKKNYSGTVNTILRVSKRESIGNYLIMYVYRISHNGNNLLDIFSIDRSRKEDISLDTIFCEQDLDSFFDFITSIRKNNG